MCVGTVLESECAHYPVKFFAILLLSMQRPGSGAFWSQLNSNIDINSNRAYCVISLVQPKIGNCNTCLFGICVIRLI